MTTNLAGHYVTPDGEVLPYSDEQRTILASEYVRATEAVEEAAEELRAIEAKRARIHGELVQAVGVGHAVRVDEHRSVVVEPGTKGRRSVNAIYAAERQEELLDVGLGSRGYLAPTLADVNKRLADVIAAGVDITRLINEPEPGPARVTIVDARTRL